MLHGRAERAPAWPGRPRQTAALSRRLPSLRPRRSSALAGGRAGANGTGREEGPAGITRRIPQHPPSPILRRGCLAGAGRLSGPKGDAPVAKHPRALGEPRWDIASSRARTSPSSATSGCPRLRQPRSDPPTWCGLGRGTSHPARPRLGRDCQGWSKAPGGTGWVRPKSGRAPTCRHPRTPGRVGTPPPPSPRPLLAPGESRGPCSQPGTFPGAPRLLPAPFPAQGWQGTNHGNGSSERCPHRPDKPLHGPFPRAGFPSWILIRTLNAARAGRGQPGRQRWAIPAGNVYVP